MSEGGGRGGILAAVALVACCALVPLIGLGVLAAAGGVALNYWPITLVGVALAVWAGVKLTRRVQARNRAGGEGGVSER